MKRCLICLSMGELFLNVNSLEWNELHVKYLIDKHLWPMDNHMITPSGVCNTCWQEISRFHKFFLDIQEIHNKLVKTVNSVKFPEPIEEIKNININVVPKELDIIQNSNDVVEEIKTEMDYYPYDKTESDPFKELEEVKKLDEIDNKLPKEYPKTEKNNYKIELVKSDSDSESLPNDEIATKLKLDGNKVDEKDEFIAEHYKIKCCLCETDMKTFHDMCQHFKIQHKVRGYVTCCKKKIFRRCYLIDHINFHLNPKYFQCYQCNKVLADRICLKSHLKTHQENVAKNHCCDICGKNFMCQSKLKIHITTHLPEEDKQFSCTECEKKFANKYLLSNHVHAVHLKVNAKICEICGKSLCSAGYLERHMLEHKGKPAPTFSCDICGLIVTSIKGLKRHKISIHPVSGHKEYTCTICSKVSPNINAHKSHIKFSHVMGYDHKCKICEKAFKKARTLKEHMATHTGKILYTCTWCPKTFNSNANMHSHRKKKHYMEWLETTRKKYSGKLPPEKFCNKNNLNN